MFLGNSGCVETTSYINEVGQRVVRNFDACLQSNLMNGGMSEWEAREAATTFSYGPMPQGEAPGFQTGAPASYTPTPAPSPTPFNYLNPGNAPASAPAAGPSMWFPVAPSPAPAPVFTASSGGTVSLPAPTVEPMTFQTEGGPAVPMSGEVNHFFDPAPMGSGALDPAPAGVASPSGAGSGDGFPLWLLAAAAAGLLLL